MRVPIASEAWPFAVPLLLLALPIGWWRPWAAVPPVLLAAFVLWFFRDPEREPPADPTAVVSPADGRVIRAADGRLSIFLNIFNVHVCRSPLGGRIDSWNHVPGRFLAAFKHEASEQNERAEVIVNNGTIHVRLTLVAGLIARRIVRWVEGGQRVSVAQRIGLIRFGSRVDLELPPSARLEVRVGDRVVAGESVLARLGDGPPPSIPV